MNGQTHHLLRQLHGHKEQSLQCKWADVPGVHLLYSQNHETMPSLCAGWRRCCASLQRAQEKRGDWPSMRPSHQVHTALLTTPQAARKTGANCLKTFTSRHRKIEDNGPRFYRVFSNIYPRRPLEYPTHFLMKP